MDLSAPQQAPARSGEVLDPERLLEGVDNDFELLCDIIAIFVDEYPNNLRRVKQAIDERDHRTLAREAHTLRGSIANFVADGAYQVAFRLEEMGRRNFDLGPAPEVLHELARELKDLESALLVITET